MDMYTAETRIITAVMYTTYSLACGAGVILERHAI